MNIILQLTEKLSGDTQELFKEAVNKFRKTYLCAVNESTKKDYTDFEDEILTHILKQSSVEDILTSIMHLENDLNEIKDKLEEEQLKDMISTVIIQVGNLFELYTEVYYNMTKVG